MPVNVRDVKWFDKIKCPHFIYQVKIFLSRRSQWMTDKPPNKLTLTL